MLASSLARASDRVEVVVIESVADDGNDDAVVPGTAAPPGSSSTARTIQVVEHLEPVRSDRTWFGVSAGAVVMPHSRTGSLSPSPKIDANRMHACVGPTDRASCTGLRGADIRLSFFTTKQSITSSPRVVGFLRSGYELGQAGLDPRDGARHERGEPTSIAYVAVPVSFGLNVYGLMSLPVRPFVGFGVGADIVKLRYTRRDDTALGRTSARLAFELHGGLEARFTNYVALTAEARHQWGRRHRVADMPQFHNTGLAVIVGLAISIPYGTVTRRNTSTHRVTSVSRVTRPTQPPVTPERIAPRQQVEPPEPAVEAPPTETPAPITGDPLAPVSVSPE